MHGRRALLFIVVSVTCLLAFVIAAYVVLSKFRPEDEIRRMLVAMSEVQTIRERSAFSWTRGEGKSRVTTTLYATGQFDLSNPSRVDQATKFRLFRLSRSKDYADLSGEIRTIDGISHLTYAPPGPDVDGIDFADSDTWVSFASGELPQWGAIIPGLDDPFGNQDAGNVERAGDWTPEGIARLRYLLSRADIFVVAYDDVTELISAHATRVIDARFDPDALRSFLRDGIRARENREPTTAERLEVEDQAKALEKLDVRFWIGIDDHLLYRVQAAGAIPDATGQAGENVLVPFDLIVELSGANDPFEWVAPSVSFSFYEVLGRTLGSYGESSSSTKHSMEFLPDDVARLPTESVTTSADPDNDGLSNLLEAFYRTNPNVADTDGDGIRDGEEVLSGKNPRGEGTLFGFGLGE
ncbi:hypothetical protein A2348_02995 [Candidatus Uhrbacteria bacterium RIFOXYB12_FULL_58_10]|uniref:Uncharacterized protein n=1 Tax=Candidatus Uhrbacteria bacterium RIFOXYB2_FULL_57_15 TaxID=1802422 RepID=A0A1F7W8K5_9BACT|nr:MAG: hypothetical protein A2348_02995 [Candidatus Uhrbacteria bacterium RIFOXYB12_FULL_58_10]OGL98424.1 MAG: hypothetical protein A2304_01890 [Candidatus Uhrbacteria bacterium RIFOXYB2_FULL_57_15]